MGNSYKSYKKWLDYALNDLAWTKSNLKEKVWYGACFTAQQTGEKTLKAYLIRQEKKIKKIHDLRALLEKCIKADQSFEQLRNQCASLNVYYAPTRYPDISDFVDFTEEKAREAYKFAEEIVEFVKNKL